MKVVSNIEELGDTYRSKNLLKMRGDCYQILWFTIYCSPSESALTILKISFHEISVFGLTLALKLIIWFVFKVNSFLSQVLIIALFNTKLFKRRRPVH